MFGYSSAIFSVKLKFMFAFCSNHFSRSKLCPPRELSKYLIDPLYIYYICLFFFTVLSLTRLPECFEKGQHCNTDCQTPETSARRKSKGKSVEGKKVKYRERKGKYAYVMQIACTNMVITVGNAPVMSQALELGYYY